MGGGRGSIRGRGGPSRGRGAFAGSGVGRYLPVSMEFPQKLMHAELTTAERNGLAKYDGEIIVRYTKDNSYVPVIRVKITRNKVTEEIGWMDFLAQLRKDNEAAQATAMWGARLARYQSHRKVLPDDFPSFDGKNTEEFRVWYEALSFDQQSLFQEATKKAAGAAPTEEGFKSSSSASAGGAGAGSK